MRQCIITITSSSGHHDQVIFSLVADTVFPSACPAQRLMSRSGPSSKPLEVFLTPTPPCTQDGATRLPAQLRDGPIVTMAQSLPNPATRQMTADLLRATGDALAPAVDEQDTPRANQKGLEGD